MTYFPIIIGLTLALIALTALVYLLLVRVERLEKKVNWYQR